MKRISPPPIIPTTVRAARIEYQVYRRYSDRVRGSSFSTFALMAALSTFRSFLESRKGDIISRSSILQMVRPSSSKSSFFMSAAFALLPWGFSPSVISVSWYRSYPACYFSFVTSKPSSHFTAASLISFRQPGSKGLTRSAFFRRSVKVSVPPCFV